MAQLDLNLNLLTTLDVLLAEESVNRTAARFGISQAAVSVQLAKLRAHFGDEILVIKGRRLIKTPFAESLVEPVRALISDARALIGLRQGFDPSTSSREFHIQAGDIDSVLLLSRAIRKLQYLAPDVVLHIHGTAKDREKMDFFIHPLGLHDEQLKSCTLYEDRYCVLADKGHPLIENSISVEDYFSQRHIVRHFGFDGAPSFEALTMSRLGYKRLPGPVVEFYTSIPYILSGTQYLSTVPEHFADEMVRLFQLKKVPLPFDFPEQILILQWDERISGDMAALWLKNLMLEVALELYD